MIYTVIESRNPLTGENYKRHVRNGPENLADVVADIFGERPVTVRVNGVNIGNDHHRSVTLRGGEFVELIIQAEAPLAIAIAGGKAAFAALTLFQQFVLTAVTTIGFNAVVGAITRHFAKSDSRGLVPEQVPVYTIETGFNQARQFAAMPRVIGRHRIYPDEVTKPFTELFIGPNDGQEIVARDIDVISTWQPVFGDDWTDFGGGIFLSPDPADSVPDNAINVQIPNIPQYVYNPAGGCQTDNGEYMLLSDYQASGSWDCDNQIWYEGEGFWGINGPDDPGVVGTLPPSYEIRYTEPGVPDEPHRHSRVNTIFNAGWGDLELTSPRIRETNFDEFKQSHYLHGTQTDVACELFPYMRHAIGDATENTTHYAARTDVYGILNGITGQVIPVEFAHWPECITTEPGAALRNNDEVNAIGEQFVERTSPRDTIQCQLDFAGELYNYNGSPIGSERCTFRIQYAQEGTDNWVNAPGSPLTIANNDVNILHRPFIINFPNPDYWDVRVWQVTPDVPNGQDGNRVINMSVSEFRFQRNWMARYPIAGDQLRNIGGAWPANTYIEDGEFDTRGQNRIGIVLQANEQLNGPVNKFDVIAEGRTWVWTGGAAWDGTFPGQGANWVWDFTSNPADRLIEEALGGFYNSGAQIAPLAGRGWNLGPSADNEEALFGAGLTYEEISFEEIIRWRDFCVREDLQVDTWTSDAESSWETLNKIAAVGRGRCSWWPGKLAVVWEEKYQAPVAMFNAANIIIDSLSISYASEELPDAVRGTYSDSTDDRYEEQFFRANRPDLGPTRFVTKINQFDLWGIARPTQARRAVRLEAARLMLNRRTITFKAATEGMLVVPADVVALGHDLTRWAIGSRLYSVIPDGDFIRSVELMKPEKWDGSGPLYAWVQHPDGRSFQGQVEPWTGEASEVRLIGDWWSVVDGPEVQDHDGTIGPDADCLGVESFKIQIGPVESPGKRVRITDIEPDEEGLFEFTCVDEWDELWAHDIGTEDFTAPDNRPESGEHIDVCARDCCVSQDATGRWWLNWESEGASEFTVSISIDGGTWTPGQTVYGRSLELPAYPAGTAINFSVCPCVPGADATPYPVGAVPAQIYSGGCCTGRYVITESEVCQ